MDLRRIIPSDITASAIAHLSLLTLLLLFSDVHPFGAVTAEQIPVEIVTPQDLCRKAGSCRNAAVRRTSGCREHAGTNANAAAGFLPARQACCGERTSAVSATSHGRAAAEAGCPGHSDCGSAASGGSARSTGGGAWLQAARARSVDQIPGVAGLAAGSVANPAAGSGAGSRQGRRQFRRAGDPGGRYRQQPGRGISAAPQDLLETAGVADQRRRRQGQVARTDDTGRPARR